MMLDVVKKLVVLRERSDPAVPATVVGVTGTSINMNEPITPHSSLVSQVPVIGTSIKGADHERGEISIAERKNELR